MSALLAVYERDLVLVRGQGRAALRPGGPELPRLRGGHRGERPRLRRPQGAWRRSRSRRARCIHASNLFHTEPASALAERLVALAFPSRVFFCNSGSEAWEGAMKFARKIGKPKGRFEFLCFERAFHGRTMGALSTTWNPKYREPFEPLVPGVRFLPWNDLAAVEAALTEKTAAVMLEPVQGEGGVRPAPPAFLQGLRKLTAGAGRAARPRRGAVRPRAAPGSCSPSSTRASPPTSSPWPSRWAAACPWARSSCARTWPGAIAVGDHGSTFGGNPVAAAASLAVLDRLHRPRLPGGRGAARRLPPPRASRSSRARTRARSPRCAASGSWSGSSSRGRRDRW